MKNIFNSNAETYVVNTYNGIYGDKFLVTMAYATLVPKTTGGYYGRPEKDAGHGFMSWPEFEKWMNRMNCKLHHTSSHMNHYQSKNFNEVEKYEGRFGKGYKVWSNSPCNRGSALCTYYIFENK